MKVISSTILKVSLKAIFVILWTSGFIVGKIAVDYIQPFALLLIRYTISTVFFLFIAYLINAPFPTSLRQIIHISIVGIFVHVLYLGCVFMSLDMGIPAGIVTLLAALQPIITAIFASILLKERNSSTQIFGILLGFIGVILVISDSLNMNGELFGYLFGLMATIALAIGVIFEKKFCAQCHLISTLTIQYFVASVLLMFITLLIGDMVVTWKYEFILVLLWLTFMCSVVSYLLLFYLTREGSATKVSSLVYITPPLAMITAYFLFDDTLNLYGIIGTIFVIIGVAIVNNDHILFYPTKNKME